VRKNNKINSLLDRRRERGETRNLLEKGTQSGGRGMDGRRKKEKYFPAKIHTQRSGSQREGVWKKNEINGKGNQRISGENRWFGEGNIKTNLGGMLEMYTARTRRKRVKSGGQGRKGEHSRLTAARNNGTRSKEGQ